MTAEAQPLKPLVEVLHGYPRCCQDSESCPPPSACRGGEGSLDRETGQDGGVRDMHRIGPPLKLRTLGREAPGGQSGGSTEEGHGQELESAAEEGGENFASTGNYALSHISSCT